MTTDPPTAAKKTAATRTAADNPGGHPSLAVALVAFQTEMPVVPKGKVARVPTKAGGEYTYSYADLPDVVAAATPVLTRHGLSFTAHPGFENGGPVLRGILRHVSGEHDEGALPLYGRTAQEIGSSLTYARRYLLGCMTGIVTDEDNDGSLAVALARSAEPPYYGPTSQEILDLISQHAITLGKTLEEVTQQFRDANGGVPVEALVNAPPQVLTELESVISGWVSKRTQDPTLSDPATPGPGASGEQPPA